MITEEDFFTQYDTWYASTQGSYVLSCSMHLSKKMLSHWPRRGNNILVIGFGHWKSLEMLWENGFDVSAIAASKAHIDTARQALHQRVEIFLHAFENLPFDDKTFDYVIVSPPPRPKAYPDLNIILHEARRLATKGILLQFWNKLPFVNPYKTSKKLPFFLQHRWCISFRQAHKSLRDIAPNCSIVTGSTLIGPPSTWKENSFLHRVNCKAVPLPIGNLVQLRLNLTPQAPLTGIPLKLDSVKITKAQPLIAMERQNNNFDNA